MWNEVWQSYENAELSGKHVKRIIECWAWGTPSQKINIVYIYYLGKLASLTDCKNVMELSDDCHVELI